MAEHQIAASLCNICGGDKFGPGPGGRSSLNGRLPQCKSCLSLERHRTARAAILDLRTDEFQNFNVLQISQDRCVEPDWFAQHFVSIYGTETSLDLQKIDRPSSVFDLVICNHVLEHVQYDNAALQELCRIIKEDGFVFLTFPDPANIANTVDWGFPREDQHGHYRIYGRDVENMMREHLGHRWVLSQTVADPATGVDDLVYFLAKSSAGVRRVIGKYPNAAIICKPAASR